MRDVKHARIIVKLTLNVLVRLLARDVKHAKVIAKLTLSVFVRLANLVKHVKVIVKSILSVMFVKPYAKPNVCSYVKPKERHRVRTHIVKPIARYAIHAKASVNTVNMFDLI